MWAVTIAAGALAVQYMACLGVYELSDRLIPNRVMAHSERATLKVLYTESLCYVGCLFMGIGMIIYGDPWYITLKRTHSVFLTAQLFCLPRCRSYIFLLLFVITCHVISTYQAVTFLTYMAIDALSHAPMCMQLVVRRTLYRKLERGFFAVNIVAQLLLMSYTIYTRTATLSAIVYMAVFPYIMASSPIVIGGS
jgi:hypothetical protein